MNKFGIGAIFLLVSVAAAAEDAPVGSIKTLEGQVVILRDGRQVQATLRGAIFQQDGVRTGPDGRVGIILRDDTMLSLGPKSEMNLKEYIFEPKDDQFSLWIKMLKGTFVYLSGVIGKLSPDSIRLDTPETTIGVRGTRLLISVEGH